MSFAMELFMGLHLSIVPFRMNMMKKKIYLLLIVAMLLSVSAVFSGCNQSVSNVTTTSTSTTFCTSTTSISTSTTFGTSTSTTLTTTTTTSTTTTTVIGPVGGEITFSGLVWYTKSRDYRVGPGNNYFSDSIENVWVDGEGRLHLKITYRGGKWYCASLRSKDSFGYGRYKFDVATRFDLLDKNAVVGLFTWDDNPAAAPYYREIDIEFAYWGNYAWHNLNYSVQPYATAGNTNNKTVSLTTSESSHSINWQSDHIAFESTSNGNIIHSWNYVGLDIPTPGEEKAHINLWLNDSDPPSDGQPIEVIIKSFEHDNP